MNENESEIEYAKKVEHEVKQKKGMGRFEKIFWFTIAIFALIWIVLLAMNYMNNKMMVEDSNGTTILSPKTIETIIEDNDFLKKNLKDSQTVKHLKEELDKQQMNIEASIDEQLDNAFAPAYNNIDTFLDFHYSVIGEYSELLAGATGEIVIEIQTRLFGDNFEKYLKDAEDNINSVYIESLKKYLDTVDSEATKGVDRDLNLDILSHLANDINQRFAVQYIKAGVVAGSRMSYKIVNVVSAKLATKAGTKLATKVATKTATKSAAASIAAAAGVACGPFVWLCSPIAATAAWFGTDAIVVAGDEYFNRDDFKNEIIQMLDELKQRLAVKLKNAYVEKLVLDSVSIQEYYESTAIKRKTVREKIDEIGI